MPFAINGLAVGKFYRGASPAYARVPGNPSQFPPSTLRTSRTTLIPAPHTDSRADTERQPGGGRIEAGWAQPVMGAMVPTEVDDNKGVKYVGV